MQGGLSQEFIMPRERASQAAQKRLQVEVLGLSCTEPRLSNYDIVRQAARNLGRNVNVSTVRGIIQRFAESEEELPPDAQRSERPPKFRKRVCRCE